jgi:hypothetical protein
LVNDIGDGKSLARAGYTQQSLMHFAIIQAFDQLLDRRGLVTSRLKWAMNFEWFFHFVQFSFW